MPKEQRRFADDGWAFWIDGDENSTVYLNDWLNPKGKSYVDVAVSISGVHSSRALYVYAPFALSAEDLVDVSLSFNDTKVLQATFSAACIVDYKKNEHASEIAYNGKTVDILHISTMKYKLERISEGTLISIDIEGIQSFIDNDEAYLIWRMPHRSLDEIFKPRVNMGNILTRLRDLITTPVVSEKYSYSVRINEARRLPEEITRIGAFHRQKLKRAVVTISINENYEFNDADCYGIRRLEENLYKDYLPSDYSTRDIITYQWQQSREDNPQGHFNFYYSIARESISRASMFLYMVLLMTVSIAGALLAAWIQYAFGLFS